MNNPHTPHGTLTGYRTYLCRCDKCRKAHREHVRQWRESKRGTEPPRHGTMNGYTNYGCRCEECCEASRANSQLRRDVAKAKETPL